MTNWDYEEAKGEGGDDGEADGDSGELEVAEVADEDLGRGIRPVEAYDVEGDRRRDRP